MMRMRIPWKAWQAWVGAVIIAASASSSACGGDGNTPAEGDRQTPDAGTTVLSPGLPEVGQVNSVGGLEITVLEVSILTADEMGRALPEGQERWMRVNLGVVNPTGAPIALPDFTLTCAGKPIGGRVADDSADALVAGPVAPGAPQFGSLLFALAEPCRPGLLVARVAPAAGGRPGAPVTIRID